jgi:hypothetical protein
MASHDVAAGLQVGLNQPLDVAHDFCQFKILPLFLNHSRIV